MHTMDIASFTAFGAGVFAAFIVTRFTGPGRRRRNVILYGLGAIMVAAAACLNLAAWRRWFMPSLDFVAGSAVVVVEQSRIEEHQPLRRTSSDPLTGYVYDVVVHYVFTADGRKWVGHGVLPSARDLPEKDQAEAKQAKFFQPGAKVTVYYDPDDPYENSLDTISAPPGRLDLSVFHGILFIITALSAFALGYAAWNRNDRASRLPD